MTAGNAILIVAIVTGLGLIGALFFVMFKIRQISREFFGTSSLIEGLKRQEALEDDTPKSVSGMTRVELPRIEKDFPEFHWPEWKQRCENQLKGYLEALEQMAAFFGIAKFDCVAAEGLDIGAWPVVELMEQAKEKAAEVAKAF